MTTRKRLIQIISDWSDDPDASPEGPWDSVLRVNVLLATEKEFGIQIPAQDILAITDLKSLLAYLEPRAASKKVLVLDCDGVLWEGIVGEGTAKVTQRCSNLQSYLITLEAQGALLALCSKNNPQDVHDAFATLPQMQLTEAQICASEISWDSKVDGLKRLAARLNLGLDSFVFVDDSPVERAEVAERLPEVTVLDVSEPLHPYFSKLGGKSLTEQYRLRQTVAAAEAEATDRQAFLDSLDMRAVMRVNDESLAPRIAELSQKTNQFNMTLRRFTEEDVRRKMQAGFAFCASLKDRFGDAGWVAQAIFANPDDASNDSDDDVILEDFCVSCRVIGRGFERAFIEKCMSHIAAQGWSAKIYYVPGPKNAVCASFFDGQKVAEHVPRASVKWEE